MTNKYVLIMALVYSGAAGASTSLALWMPQLVKSFGLSNWQTGLVNAVPFGIAAVWMVLWGRSSDRTGERVWHNALPLGWMVLAMIATFCRDRQSVGDDPAADADRCRHLRQQGSVLGAVVGMARRGVRGGGPGADQRARATCPASSSTT